MHTQTSSTLEVDRLGAFLSRNFGEKALAAQAWIEVLLFTLLEAVSTLVVVGQVNRSVEPRYLLFIPFGIALFALIKKGPKMLIGIFIGSMIARSLLFTEVLHAAIVSAVYTAAFAAGHLALKRMHFDGRLRGPVQLFKLVLTSLLICSICFVSLLSASLYLGLFQAGIYTSFRFFVIELGNFSGLVLITSLLILWTQPEKVESLSLISFGAKTLRMLAVLAATLLMHHINDPQSLVSQGSVIDFNFFILITGVAYFWGSRYALVAASLHLFLHGYISFDATPIYSFLPDQGQTLLNPSLQNPIVDILIVLFILTLELHLREQQATSEAALATEKAKNTLLMQKKDMVRSFGHEFSSPLYILEAIIKEAKARPGNDMMTLLMDAQSQISRMKRVSNQLQTHHSLLATENISLVAQSMDATELAEVLKAHCEEFDPMGRLKFRVTVPQNFPDFELPVSGFLKVAEELSRNALDHSHPELADVELQIRLFMANKQPQLEYSVANSISQEALNVIREKNGLKNSAYSGSEWQLKVNDEQAFSDSDHRGRDNNLGLGLTIAREMSSLLRARLILSVHCAKSRYTARFFMPLTSIKAQQELAKPYSQQPVTKRPTVYVVDDCPVNIKLAKARLGRLDVVIRAYSNPKQAVAEILQSATSIDMVLMDLQMPDLSGYEATKLIRMARPELALPIYAYTASSELECAAELKASGLDGYLSKMYSPDRIRAVVARTVKVASVVEA